MKTNELEFETLKSNKNRLYLLCGIVCVVVLLITVIVSNTFAFCMPIKKETLFFF